MEEILDKLAKFSRSKIEGNFLLKSDSACVVTDISVWEENFQALQQRPEKFKEIFVFGKQAKKEDLAEISLLCKNYRYAVTFDKNLVQSTGN